MKVQGNVQFACHVIEIFQKKKTHSALSDKRKILQTRFIKKKWLYRDRFKRNKLRTWHL